MEVCILWRTVTDLRNVLILLTSLCVNCSTCCYCHCRYCYGGNYCCPDVLTATLGLNLHVHYYVQIRTHIFRLISFESKLVLPADCDCGRRSIVSYSYFRVLCESRDIESRDPSEQVLLTARRPPPSCDVMITSTRRSFCDYKYTHGRCRRQRWNQI